MRAQGRRMLTRSTAARAKRQKPAVGVLRGGQHLAPVTSSARAHKMIHLIQLLCPDRHCIVACAWDDRGTRESDLHDVVEDAIDEMKAAWSIALSNGFHPWCGICGSRDLKYEDKITNWKSIDEALPALRECEAAQTASRAIIDQIRGRRN